MAKISRLAVAFLTVLALTVGAVGEVGVPRATAAETPKVSSQTDVRSQASAGVTAEIPNAVAPPEFGPTTVTPMLLAALIPTFSTPVATATGFRVNVTNYNAAYTFTPTIAAGRTGTVVWEGTASGAIRGLAITGVAAGVSSTVSVATSRTGYESGVGTVTGTTLPAAPAPTFSTPVSTADGFTVNVTNALSSDMNVYAMEVGSTGKVTQGIFSAGVRPLTVTGMAAGASSTVKVTVIRMGFANTVGTVTGSAFPAVVTPTFSAPVSTATGFTVDVTNYDAAYTFTPSIAAGSAGAVTWGGIATGAIRPLTVTGLAVGASSTVSVVTTRAGYGSGAATVTGSAILGAALTPMFSIPVSTPTGFTVSVTNYNTAYTFAPSMAVGSTGTVTAGTASGAILPLTVTGMVASASSTVSVVTTRTGYVSGTATVTGSAIPAGVTPTFSAPVSTATGFTVNVTNYDDAYTFTPSITAGSPGAVAWGGPATGAIRSLTVTGLAAGASSTVSVATARTGFAPGVATVVGSAIQGAALIPTFSTPVPTADGFVVNITNYNSAYQFGVSIQAGSTGAVKIGNASGSNLSLIVTGMVAPASSTVTVLATRTGYVSGTASVTGVTLPAGVKPTFSVPVATANGFTVNVTNIDAAYRFTPSIAAGGAGSLTSGSVIGAILPLTVTGLAVGASSTVSVATTRAGFAPGVATVVGSAIQGAALTPTFSAPVSTVTGFTVNVTNYNAAYTFAPSIPAGSTGTVTAGTASGAILPLTVTGMVAPASSTVNVTTTRTGYLPGAATVTGSAIQGAALTPTFSTPQRTATGFMVNVTNYSTLYTFTPSMAADSTGTLTAGTATGAILPLTVTGVAAGASSRLSVATTRAGYESGVGTLLWEPAPAPTFSIPVPTADGFTVNIMNALSNDMPSFAMEAGSTGNVSKFTSISESVKELTVTGMAAGASSTLKVTVQRPGFAETVGTVTGSSLGLMPTFSTAVPTATGFTVNVTNFNAAYTFTPSIALGSTGMVTAGTASGTSLPLTVTGLAAGVSSTVNVVTTRTGYASGMRTVTGTSLLTGAVPTFDTPVSTATGFTVGVTNWAGNMPSFAMEAGSTGTVTAGPANGAILPLTVTGVAAGVESSVVVYTDRASYVSGIAMVTGSALQGAALAVTRYHPAWAFKPSQFIAV